MSTRTLYRGEVNISRFTRSRARHWMKLVSPSEKRSLVMMTTRDWSDPGGTETPYFVHLVYVPGLVVIRYSMLLRSMGLPAELWMVTPTATDPVRCHLVGSGNGLVKVMLPRSTTMG